MKALITLLILTLIPLISTAAENRWTNECPGVSERYCPNVGKTGNNSFNNPPILRGKKLGKIKGVTWRPKGSTIAYVEGVSDAGIPEKKIKAQKDAIYYIIEDGTGKVFLRKCVDVVAK
ncbi:MAG: hypothetical protein IME96_03220 [Proteobacteria bacterium]|nr:hypothetical protein [Pseudomonadota bacterium]